MILIKVVVSLYYVATIGKQTEDWRNRTETTVREGLEKMDWMEGQADCKAGKVEKSNQSWNFIN